MKRIEDIENLAVDELERIADDAGIEIPEGLDAKLVSTIVASDSGSIAPRRYNTLKIVTGTVATGIAACLAVLLMVSGGPKDTYDDPKLAYAELERTMSLISSKMERGLQMAAEAAPALEVTDRIINGKIEIE